MDALEAMTMGMLQAVAAKSCTSRQEVGGERCGRYPCARCKAYEALGMFLTALREEQDPRHVWRGNTQPAGSPQEWRCTMCGKRVPMTSAKPSTEGCITWDEAARARRVRAREAH